MRNLKRNDANELIDKTEIWKVLKHLLPIINVIYRWKNYIKIKSFKKKLKKEVTVVQKRIYQRVWEII